MPESGLNNGGYKIDITLQFCNANTNSSRPKNI